MLDDKKISTQDERAHALDQFICCEFVTMINQAVTGYYNGDKKTAPSSQGKIGVLGEYFDAEGSYKLKDEYVKENDVYKKLSELKNVFDAICGKLKEQAEWKGGMGIVIYRNNTGLLDKLVEARAAFYEDKLQALTDQLKVHYSLESAENRLDNLLKKINDIESAEKEIAQQEIKLRTPMSGIAVSLRPSTENHLTTLQEQLETNEKSLEPDLESSTEKLRNELQQFEANNSSVKQIANDAIRLIEKYLDFYKAQIERVKKLQEKIGEEIGEKYTSKITELEASIKNIRGNEIILNENIKELIKNEMQLKAKMQQAKDKQEKSENESSRLKEMEKEKSDMQSIIDDKENTIKIQSEDLIDLQKNLRQNDEKIGEQETLLFKEKEKNETLNKTISDQERRIADLEKNLSKVKNQSDINENPKTEKEEIEMLLQNLKQTLGQFAFLLETVREVIMEFSKSHDKKTQDKKLAFIGVLKNKNKNKKDEIVAGLYEAAAMPRGWLGFNLFGSTKTVSMLNKAVSDQCELTKDDLALIKRQGLR